MVFALLTISFDSTCQIKSYFELRTSYPICVSSDANSYLLNSLHLKKNGIMGFSYGLSVVSKKSWFFSTSGIYGNSYYKNDSLEISIGQNFGLIGFGKGFKINEKFSTGVSLHLGIMRSKQVILQTGNTSGNIWEKFNSNQFEQLTQLSSVKFASQVEVFFNYHMNEEITLTTGFRNSISSMKKVDYLNGIQLYKNYFMPFLGIHIWVFRSKGEKETNIEK